MLAGAGGQAKPRARREHLGAGPAVVGSELDTEQITHLAIEVGEAGLRPADDADLDIALGFEAIGEDAQGDGLACPWRSGDEGEAALADELLGTPAEGLGSAADVQRLDRHVGGEPGESGEGIMR